VPRAWISKHFFTGFACFRLFTTRQNCRAFWLLRLVYRGNWHLWHLAFEWLKIIEPNSTTLCYPRIKSKSVHPWASGEIFAVGQRWNFAYPFQVSHDAMQMDVHIMLYPFYSISLCWLNLNSQSFVLNVFHTSGIRNAFSFHKLPNIHFFEHFLQISHNLRIINGQNRCLSGEKWESCTLSQNCFKQWEVEIYVGKIVGKLTKVREPRKLKKLSRWITKTRHST